MQSTNKDEVLQLLKEIMLKGWPNAKTGIPAMLATHYNFRELTAQDRLIFRGERLVIPNSPRFTSDKFADFAREWDFKHRTSSPGHQQANGRAEAAVKAAKNILCKAEESGNDPYLAILAVRNTLTEEMDTSPAQRLLGRRSKTLLPMTKELLKPQSMNTEKIRTEKHEKPYKP